MPNKFTCECGKTISHSSYVKHIRTEKHILIIKIKELINVIDNEDLINLLINHS